jgi:hypothetical protein
MNGTTKGCDVLMSSAVRRCTNMSHIIIYSPEGRCSVFGLGRFVCGAAMRSGEQEECVKARHVVNPRPGRAGIDHRMKNGDLTEPVVVRLGIGQFGVGVGFTSMSKHPSTLCNTLLTVWCIKAAVLPSRCFTLPCISLSAFSSEIKRGKTAKQTPRSIYTSYLEHWYGTKAIYSDILVVRHV